MSEAGQQCNFDDIISSSAAANQDVSKSTPYMEQGISRILTQQ